MRHSRIIRRHVEKLPALLQRPHDLRPLAFQDAHHRPRHLRPVTAVKISPAHVLAHQHTVLVQRRARVPLGHGHLRQARIVRLEKTLARPVHADATRDQVRLARAHVAIALDARDLPGLFQLSQYRLQLLLLVRRQPELSQQFRHIRRHIIFLAQKPEDLVFHFVLNLSIARGLSPPSKICPETSPNPI